LTLYRKKETDKENYVSVVTCDLFNSSDFRVSVSPERLFSVINNNTKMVINFMQCACWQGAYPQTINLLSSYGDNSTLVNLFGTKRFRVSLPTDAAPQFLETKLLIPLRHTAGEIPRVVRGGCCLVREKTVFSQSFKWANLVCISCSTNHRQYTPIAAAPGYLRSLPPWSACLTWFVSDGYLKRFSLQLDYHKL